MRNALAALVVLLAVSAVAQSPAPGEQVLDVSDFSRCGLQTKLQPNKLPDPSCFQFVENAVIDQDGSLLRRNGYQPYNSTASTGTQALRGLWAFTDANGSAYLIAQTSASMVASLGNGAFTAINGLNGGLSTTAQMSCVQCLGALYCTDGTDPVFSIGTALSTQAVSQAPLGKYAGCFRNRVLISGVSGTQTDLYLSGQVNGLDWTLPTTVTLSTSPAIINVAGINDGFSVKCLMGEFQNTYLIGRDYDTYGLTGNDLRDFTLRKVDGQIGCMDNNSPEVVNNALMWLSHRGVELLSGPQIAWASQPIDPTLKVIINAAGNSQSSTINNANFTQGNLTASGPGAPISSTILPGNLTVSSFSVSDSGFSSGNSSDVVFVNGSLQPKTLFPNAGFELGNLNSWAHNGMRVVTAGNQGVPSGNSFMTCAGCGGWVATGALTSFSSGTFQALNGSTVILSTPTGIPQDGQCLAAPLDVSTLTVSSISVRFLSATSLGGPESLTSFNGNNPFTTPPGVLYIVTCSSEGNFSVDFPQPYIASSSTYISASFNTGFSTPIAQMLPVISSDGVKSGLTTTIQYSANGLSGWGSSSNQYVRYNLTLIENATGYLNGISSPSINSPVNLIAETTGYYITPCVTVSTPTSWGNLTVNAVTNGGSFSFWTATGPTCAVAIATNAAWVAQTANSVITAATLSTPVLAVRVLFSLDVATEVPTLNNIVVNWNAGASRPAVASAQYQNKYYLFYTTSQAVGSTNDHAVVFDQNGRWQLLDDVKAASTALYQNSLYLGDSNATGTAYLYDTGNSDNGGSFNFAFTTPDLDGGDPVAQKTWSRAYLTLGAPNTVTAGTTISCNYTLDGSTETFSLGTVALSESPTQSGYFVAKLPFPLASPTASRWVNLSCSNTGANGPIRVYGYRIVFSPLAWP